MSREHYGWVIWVGWLALFCGLESAAVWLRAPWPTFSRTVWDAQARWDFLTVPVVAILAILASHLVRRRGIEEGDDDRSVRSGPPRQ